MKWGLENSWFSVHPISSNDNHAECGLENSVLTPKADLGIRYFKARWRNNHRKLRGNKDFFVHTPILFTSFQDLCCQLLMHTFLIRWLLLNNALWVGSSDVMCQNPVSSNRALSALSHGSCVASVSSSQAHCRHLEGQWVLKGGDDSQTELSLGRSPVTNPLFGELYLC